MTFDEWWYDYRIKNGMLTTYRVKEEIARSAWEAARVESAGWMFAGRGEDLPEGGPVNPGTKLYAFDVRGTWTYELPPLPNDARAGDAEP